MTDAKELLRRADKSLEDICDSQAFMPDSVAELMHDIRTYLAAHEQNAAPQDVEIAGRSPVMEVAGSTPARPVSAAPDTPETDAEIRAFNVWMNASSGSTYESYDLVYKLIEVLRSLERRLRECEADAEQYKRAFPSCEKHKPTGGSRAACLICALEKLSAALSEIDYICGEPNDMQLSGYDVHCDEDAVVKHVRTLKEKCVKLFEAAFNQKEKS